MHEEMATAMKQDIQAQKDHIDNIYVLATITRLRQIACTPLLTLNNREILLDKLSADALCQTSGKLTELFRRLEELRGTGHKALLFSDYTGFLDTIAAIMEKRGWKYAMLTGQTRDREATIATFQNNDGLSVLPRLTESRWRGPQPHLCRLCLPPRPLVEHCSRGTSRQPCPPHRTAPLRLRLSDDHRRHPRREDHECQEPQAVAHRCRAEKHIATKLFLHRLFTALHDYFLTQLLRFSNNYPYLCILIACYHAIIVRGSDSSTDRTEVS